MNPLSTTSDSILACARALLANGGYHSFSYADIATVVGIRKASIHHHFPSKVDLVRTLVASYRQGAEDGLRNLEQSVPGPADLLRAYVGYWKTCIADASAPFCVCALLAGELPVLPDEVAVEVRAYFRFLAGWLRTVLERGRGDGTLLLRHAPEVEAEMLMAAVHGAMLSARAYGDPATFGVIMDRHLQQLASGS